MKTLFAALLVVCTALLPGLALAQNAADAPAPVADDQKPAVEAAQAWLARIDAGRYGESWREASASFQKAISETDWTRALTGARQPLGACASRSLRQAKSAAELPGAPDGQYVVMEFDAAFANKQKASELVTFMRDPDGAWRAAGYFIR